MTTDKLQFADLILKASDRDITYLEITSLQKVIDFKWASYTKAFFLWRFGVLGLFIAGFLLDLYMC